MKPLLGYLALCVGVGVWSAVEARLSRVRLARAQLKAFSRRVKRSP